MTTRNRSDRKCAGLPYEVFFPHGEMGQRPKESTGPRSLEEMEQEVADDICLGVWDGLPCPAREECLEEAVVYEAAHGVYGGVFGGATQSQRKVLVRERRRRGKVA